MNNVAIETALNSALSSLAGDVEVAAEIHYVGGLKSYLVDIASDLLSDEITSKQVAKVYSESNFRARGKFICKVASQQPSEAWRINGV